MVKEFASEPNCDCHGKLKAFIIKAVYTAIIALPQKKRLFFNRKLKKKMLLYPKSQATELRYLTCDIAQPLGSPFVDTSKLTV